MALISCPNCGKEVSDRAEKCPACGFILIEKTAEEPQTSLCPECSTPLPADAEVCPNCGCPIEHIQIEPEAQKVELTKVNLSTSSKNKLVVALIAVVIIAAVAVLGIQISKNNAAATYQENINSVTSLMLLGATQAESSGGLIHDVWSDTIFDDYSVTTNKYVRNAGGDFNTALANLFSDSDFQADIQSIEDNKESVNALMKKLSSPPDDLRDEYDAVKKLYDAYLEMVNSVTNPTGSLQTFTSNFNNADSSFYNCYTAMDMYTT